MSNLVRQFMDGSTEEVWGGPTLDDCKMAEAREPRIRGCRITQTALDAARGRLLALEAQLNAEIAAAIDLGVRVVVRADETEIPERPWTIVRVAVIATAQPVVGPQPELEA